MYIYCLYSFWGFRFDLFLKNIFLKNFCIDSSILLFKFNSFFFLVHSLFLTRKYSINQTKPSCAHALTHTQV